ncbi:MAG: hypothetical protein SWH61_17420 [Thermodesulfobacteriota bacterium]|nr:hypothetical protein [Thermodesulfobacteriota bacterium]
MKFFEDHCFILLFHILILHLAVILKLQIVILDLRNTIIFISKISPFGRATLAASAALADIRGRLLQLHIGRLAAAPKSTREISGLN